MALEQQIAALTAAANGLTQEVTGKMAVIDAKVAQAQVDFNNLTPEKRIVQAITIGGSADYLYPLWWPFPESQGDPTKVTVARSFNANAADAVGALLGLKNHSHTYGLLLEMEGNGCAWSGNPSFLQIKRFRETYDVGASHVQFSMFSDPASSTTAACPVYSGCYLRGGGLTYLVIRNQAMPVQFQDGSAGVNALTEMFRNVAGHWSAKPIPLGIKAPATGLYPNIQSPVADLLAY